MDKEKLSELTDAVYAQFTQAEQVLQAYTRREVPFQQVSQELILIHKLISEIAIFLGDAARAFYETVREARKKREETNIRELGFEQ